MKNKLPNFFPEIIKKFSEVLNLSNISFSTPNYGVKSRGGKLLLVELISDTEKEGMKKGEILRCKTVYWNQRTDISGIH